MKAFLSRLWHGAVFGPDPEREEKDGRAIWTELYAAHQRTLAREDKRGMGETYPPLRQAMNERLRAEMGSFRAPPSIPSRGVSS